ncbi:MAG: TetR/AcrR family transcriptional regulator [Chloroflexi bacterium]|nr:MAG: TetR/AcrR family transcriptional regulator [Chloroflexota bacterium]TMD50996.1 MAG: TetR/AcrR family transcriptional regulator [Chloroflexota bacterium]
MMKLRERLRPDARRAQLLELGVRLFTERPYNDFTMDEIATLANVSKGLLYHYFPTKREFYMAALREATGEMLHLIEPSLSLPPVEAMRAALDAYLGFVEDHAPAYRAVLRGGVGADPEVQKIADDFRDAMAERLLNGARILQPTPEQRLAVRGWIGFVEAASLDWIDRQDLARPRLIQLLSQTFAAAMQAARTPRYLD